MHMANFLKLQAFKILKAIAGDEIYITRIRKKRALKISRSLAFKIVKAIADEMLNA